MRIRRTSQIITVGVTLVSLLTIACAAVSLRYRTLQERNYAARRLSVNALTRLADGSDRLTSAVRGYAATGDARYQDEFMQELMVERNRDRAVDLLRQAGLTREELTLLDEAKQNSDRLVSLENRAFDAAARKDMQTAIALVYGDDYRTAKASIMRPIADLQRDLDARLTDEAALLGGKARLAGNAVIGALIVNTVVVISALWFFYRRRVVNPLSDINRSLQDLIAGKSGVRFSHQNDTSEMGEVARSLESYRRAGAEAETHRWIKGQVSEIAAGLYEAERPEQFAQFLLSRVVPLVEGGCGALYLLDERSGGYRLVGGYGLAGNGHGKGSFVPGEGLVGQCVRDRAMIVLSDVPNGYLRIASGLGDAQPRTIVAVPVVSADRVLAVMEIASFGKLTEQQQGLLRDLVPVAALNLEILQRNLKTQELLEETRSQAAELQAQQQNLQENEERFRSLLEAAPDALIISDEDGLILLINAQTEKFFGYRREELVGQSVDLLVPQRVRAGHPAQRRRYFDNPNVRSMGAGLELFAVRRDGSEFPVEISLSPLHRSQGLGTLVCSSLRDITERKRLEHEVRVSEERNRLILQSTAEGIFGVDTDGRITFVNAATCSMLGFTAEELIGQPSHELIHHHRADDTDYPVEQCPMYAAYKRGAASRIEDEFLWRKDGTGLPVEYGATPMLKDGTIIGAVISFTDVTERKKAEAQLQERTRELQHINFQADTALDLTRAGYWHVPLDDSGWYNSSERAARIFGDFPGAGHRYRLDEWAAHVREGDEAAAEATLENFAAAVAGTIPAYDATYAYKRPIDGRVVWIHALGHVVKDGSGKPTDMFGVTQDVTDFKHLESDLRQAMQKAEEATKAKSAFLANMSHEIRTPMNGIMGMTELALDTDLTAEQRDYLNTVKSSAEALLSLLNDILDFSKIEAGRIELDPIEFLLRDAISDTLNPLALRAGSKGLELAYDVHSDVPDALIGDVYRLRQILVNLVGNAIKFTDRGEVVVSVNLAGRTADDLLLEVRVRDTGIGIKPEAAARLFNAFEQAEASTTRKYGGTGLGLAISRQLIAIMGGEIRLESELGVGSTFIFTARFKPSTTRASVADTDAARLLHGKIALVVDDNETNRRILTTMLGHWGLRALAADAAATALAMLDRSRNAGQTVALVITDLHMPETDGFQLTEMLRSRTAYANLPVFLLTSSSASPGDNARCTDLRVAARLLKPVKQSLLLDNILRVLAGADRIEIAAATAQPDSSALGGAAERPTLQVLLAEDNPVNQKFALRVLSGAGHHVTLANNGLEAVELANSRAFDVILMDVQMPEMDGLDATRAIRAREVDLPRHTPIIAMTANAMKGDREACIEAGMDGYVPKPVKKDVLLAEIDRIRKETTHGTVV
jgi:two-component system, sensor histidine kinase and response regulator